MLLSSSSSSSSSSFTESYDWWICVEYPPINNDWVYIKDFEPITTTTNVDNDWELLN